MSSTLSHWIVRNIGTERLFRADVTDLSHVSVVLRPLLDQLQRSEHADVQIGDSKVRLPFDDFNAARVTLEACVQKIGKRG